MVMGRNAVRSTRFVLSLRRGALLALGLLLVLVLGMATIGASAEATTLAVTDMKGRALDVKAPVTRVVVTAPADCEILFAIGGGDLLVGRGMDCNFPAEVLAVPMVNSGMTTNVEQIIALAPDAVLMNTMAQSMEQVEAIQAAGIPVVATDTTDISGMYQAIGLIGQVAGRESQAEALVQQIQRVFAEMEAKTAGNQGITVYFEVSPLQYGLWTAGQGTFLNELANLCGLTNLFADVEGWVQISQEQVLERNPDVIVTFTPKMEGQPAPAQEIAERAGWGETKAVKRQAIFEAPSDEFMRPGPRLTVAAELLAQFVQEYAQGNDQ